MSKTRRKADLGGCRGFMSGPGLLKGKGKNKTRLQRKHLQKAKLRREVVVCAIAKQPRKKTLCSVGFFPLPFDQRGEKQFIVQDLHKVKRVKVGSRALIKNGAFGLEN